MGTEGSKGWVAAGLAGLALLGCDPGGAPDATGTSEAFEVELFGAGILSTELPEFATAFSPSGDTVFFNRTPPDRSRIDLLYAVRSGTGWSEPAPFPRLAEVWAIDPFVTVDGSYLYFSSDLPRPGGLEGAVNLWRLALDGPDREPEVLPTPINTDSSDVFNAIAADGLMVFSSRRSGERRIYEVALGDPDAEPALLDLGGFPSASNPTISPDGRLLVFARSEGEAPPDLYLACRDGAGWGPPLLLPAPINSEHTEFAPGFGARHLHFTSERPGIVGPMPAGERPPGDLYRTRLEPVRALCGG